MIIFDPEPERPVWLQVMEIIRDRIKTGVYAPRSRIPSIEGIMQEWQVGRNTARHVIRDLEAQGLVRAIPSMGTFVVPTPEESEGENV